MPLFLKHRILFIHIPKCGGSTVSWVMKNLQDPSFLYIEDGSVVVNGHSAQHMTWQEICRVGWTTPPDFRVAALVRHPIDRVISEFRYLRKRRTELSSLAPDPSTFLDHFLSKDQAVSGTFDQHNLGMLDYLKNRKGIVDPDILIRPLQEIDIWLEDLGIVPAIPVHRQNVTRGLEIFPVFSQNDIDRIKSFYCEDILWFEARFPHYPPELI